MPLETEVSCNTVRPVTSLEGLVFYMNWLNSHGYNILYTLQSLEPYIGP